MRLPVSLPYRMNGAKQSLDTARKGILQSSKREAFFIAADPIRSHHQAMAIPCFGLFAQKVKLLAVFCL
jgi:hypothetical protein